MASEKNMDEFETVILPSALASAEPRIVPLVIYIGDRQRRVIGTAAVHEDGRIDGNIADPLFIEHLDQDMEVSPRPFSLYKVE